MTTLKERIEIFDLTPEQERDIMLEKNTLNTEFYNNVFSPFLYKTAVSGTEINRDIFNCSLCNNVACKSKKQEISLARKPYTFIVDGFTDGNINDTRVLFITDIVRWLGIQEGYYHITGTIKCEDGEDENCSINMLKELDYYEDDFGNSYTAVIFSDKVPSILNDPAVSYQYGNVYYIGKKPILFLPSIENLSNNPQLREQSMNILWYVFKGNQG